MNTRHLLVAALGLGLVLGASAQEESAEIAPPPVQSDEELEELLGPIALHPDALIAIILPASTVPGDIVLAARYLDSGGDPNAVDDRPWDESVRALARYPDLVRWLDKDLEWTIRVGEAFLAQPADVMKAIQRLRARAHAAGNLTDTPQQRVIVEDEVISIVPAVHEVIYVPTYDPAVVYVSYHRPYPRSFFSFSFGFPIGSWLSYECDWHSRRIWYSGWHRYRYVDRSRFHRHDLFPGQPHYFDHPGRHPWVPHPRHFDRQDRRDDRRHHPRDVVRVEPRPEPERRVVTNPWRPGTTIPAARTGPSPAETESSRERRVAVNPWRPGTTNPTARNVPSTEPSPARSVVRVEPRRQRDVSTEFRRVVERETRQPVRNERNDAPRRTVVIPNDHHRSAPAVNLPPVLQNRRGTSAPSYTPQPQPQPQAQPQSQPPAQASERGYIWRGGRGQKSDH